ncbi:hypothetical protein GCM10023238_15780 [Streptomyces heliomycini]
MGRTRPVEIWERTNTVIQNGLRDGGLSADDLAAIGITNQRETYRRLGPAHRPPYYNAIVCRTPRTDSIAAALERDGHGDVIRSQRGLAAATYCFSLTAGKIKWLLESVDGSARGQPRRATPGRNTDAWVLWNLSGGPNGGVHATDVTIASRTMLIEPGDPGQGRRALWTSFGVPARCCR